MNNKIIVMYENTDKELNMSLYDFVQEYYRNANHIMVCHVTEEEYKIMIEQIKKGCLDERKQSAKDDIRYVHYRYLMVYDPYDNCISIANYNDYEQKGNYYVDNSGIHYNENGIQFPKNFHYQPISRGVKVYTTETYEEVINHYMENSYNKQISLSKEQIKRYEKAYKKLLDTTNPRDFSEKDMRNLKALIAMIITKYNQ